MDFQLNLVKKTEETQPQSANALRDVIIIGSGPAGLTAAIYTARGYLNPLVIEGYMAGGQLMLTSEIENFPGFKDGIMGPDLMAQFRAQAERFGAEFITQDVTRVDLSEPIKKVWLDNTLYRAKAVIISTGASANMLGLKNETRLIGHGVSTCATCDGFFFRNKTICVVGGGDSAMEEALFLTRFADKVYIIHRRNEFRASKIMIQKAADNPKIEFVMDSVVVDVLGNEIVEGVRLKNVKSQQFSDIQLQGVFVAIGHTPNTQLFNGQLETNKTGYIVTSVHKHQLSATSVTGVFACGDVQDDHYRQAITAAGSGCQAALDTQHYLESLTDEALQQPVTLTAAA